MATTSEKCSIDISQSSDLVVETMSKLMTFELCLIGVLYPDTKSSGAAHVNKVILRYKCKLAQYLSIRNILL